MHVERLDVSALAMSITRHHYKLAFHTLVLPVFPVLNFPLPQIQRPQRMSFRTSFSHVHGVRLNTAVEL